MLIIFLGNKLCSFIPLIVLRATDLKQDKVLGPYHYRNKTQDYYLLGKKKSNYIALTALRATALKCFKVPGPYYYTNIQINYKIIMYWENKQYFHPFDNIEGHRPETDPSTEILSYK